MMPRGNDWLNSTPEQERVLVFRSPGQIVSALVADDDVCGRVATKGEHDSDD
jgi:hypothetical protein